METKDNNITNSLEKNISFKSKKIQDFFGLENITKKDENNQNPNEKQPIMEMEEKEDIINKNNLYNYLYESGPEIEEPISHKTETKAQIPKDIDPNKSKINLGGGILVNESINLYIDDMTRKYAKLIIQNYECKFIFDEKVTKEFVNLVHFTPKYFEFSIFYAIKGKYDEETKITTITLKDYRSFKLMTKDNAIYKKLFETLNNKIDYYRYAQYYKNIQDNKNIIYKKDGWNIYDPLAEYKRQGIEFSDKKFCFSYLNDKYQLCESYPNILVIPKKFDNKEINKIAQARTKNRFPVLSFYYSNKKGVKSYMYRSAQINKGGIIFKSKNLEVEYINTIMNLENDNKKNFVIFDCRSELNAKANALKGAGTEDIKLYNNCQNLIFGCIENIHAVRKSLKSALQKAYYGKEKVEGKISFDIKNSNMSNFLSKFENTKWLEYLSDLLIGSITVAKFLIKDVNVLVHCSDGWDRTVQVCSLVQIILDPYFRTIEGFAVLIEKEWVSFGHKFYTRNGCDNSDKKQKHRSPIFIQFIHAVHQITTQYPTSFEFNSYFLLFLCQEIYTNKYGTFLFNTEKEKFNYEATNCMISIWSDIFYNKNKYINDLYKPINGPINIKGELKYLNIWNDFFFKYDKIGMTYFNKSLLDKEDYINKIKEEKNESILELLKVIKDNGLENLIEENKLYKMFKDNIDK